MRPSLLVVAAALLLAGCGGSSESSEPSPPPPQGGASAGEREDAAATRALRAAAVEEYGTPGDEASWWELVTVMHVDQGQADVSTSFDEDDDSADAVAEICSGFLEILSSAGLEEVERVRVLDRDEHPLKVCSP